MMSYIDEDTDEVLISDAPLFTSFETRKLMEYVTDMNTIRSMNEIISLINDGKATTKNYLDLHRAVHTCVEKKYLIIIDNLKTSISELIEELIRLIRSEKNRIKFVCACPIKAHYYCSLALWTGIWCIKKTNIIRNRCAKKKMIKKCFDLPEKYHMEFYHQFTRCGFKLLEKYIYRGMKQGKYNFGNKKVQVPVAVRIARHHPKIAIRAVKHNMVDPYQFLEDLAMKLYDDKEKTVNFNHVKLIKTCFQHESQYSRIIQLNEFPRIVRNAYCFIKHTEEKNLPIETIVNYSLNTNENNYPIDLMILHRTYRGADFVVSDKGKKIYTMMSMIMSAVIGKKLTGVALYY